MRGFATAALLGVLLGLVSCQEERTEVVITETRELTTGDRPPKLMATSRERFRPTRGEVAQPASGYAFQLPEGWQERPKTSMRLLNFVAGPEGLVEVYLSQTRGDLASNIGRWYRQFGLDAPDTEALAALPRVPMLGGEGILVEAAGTYSPGMGRPDADGYGLAGVIAATDGGVLTIKMVGPEDAVKAEVDRLKSFTSSLRVGE